MSTSIDDPCDGADAFLALIDRPSVQDSVCVVKQNRFIIETGFQYTSLIDDNHNWNYPQLELRFGLPYNNEIFLLPSNYFQGEESGFGPAIIGLKHEFGYTRSWIYTGEIVLTPPSGNSTLGSAGIGVALNGIVGLALSSDVSLSLMLGISSLTLSSNENGARYYSFNPDLVVSWQPKERTQLYAEIYGQTNIAPKQGSGFNADVGIQYLLKPYWEVDAVISRRITGYLGDFNYYFGAGMGFYF